MPATPTHCGSGRLVLVRFVLVWSVRDNSDVSHPAGLADGKGRQTMTSVLIVGGGHAAGAAAAALRQAGFDGPLTLVGAEPVLPYQRPPLSKAWLKGEAVETDLLLRPATFYAEKSITLELGRRVESIDAASRSVGLDDGRHLSWDRLILATGSRLRTLPVPGIQATGVHELRSLADAEALRHLLQPGLRLAVIGGGYIGLEVAASARALGAEVIVIEREARLLARVASAPLSAFFEACHRAHGVDLRLGAAVRALIEQDGRVQAVELTDGTRIACDAVVVGIGAQAEDGLARALGLRCDDGVVVDEQCRTSAPDIFAIGDCTRRPLPRYGLTARLESVPNALEQARQVAACIMDKPTIKSDTPWFWSDQFDVRLQIVGLPVAVEQQVIRGDPASGRFAVFHLAAGGVLQAVEAVNATAEFAAARMWVGARQVLDPARIADLSLTPKQLVA
jgi:3-phenylpropionate/trans-cinnamate dioxygenase ferredoxin reductase subunit